MRAKIAIEEYEVTAATLIMERLGVDEFAPVPGDNGKFVLTVYAADWPDLRDALEENNIAYEVLPNQ